MKKLFVTFVIAGCALTYLAGQDRMTGKTFATRSEVIAMHGMVATSQPLATQAALDILKKGGNAIDAAIAADAVLGVVEPTGSGVGGDLFAIVWDAKTHKLYGLNASGRSPKALTLDYFKQHNMEYIPPFGPLPVSVPGCVDGWYELHNKFGKLPMTDVLNPAITTARDGFPVTELIAWYMEHNAKVLMNFPGFKETYMPNGHTPQKGEVFKNPNLANTLETIAQKGRDEFYKGDIAQIIAKEVQDQGGFLSYDDLASHHSEWVDPISVNYRGYDVWELPPNGQGLAVLEMLEILKGYAIASMGFGSPEYLHLFIEAKKLAYEDRAKYYTDPDFVKIPVQALISDAYAAQRRKLINPDKAGTDYEAGIPESPNTIYLTTADSEGNMVSLIQSNFRGMGSGIIPHNLGFVLQDRGQLFSLHEGDNNVYAPGKRPFHTIIPGFITKDGQPYISFGVMGGDMQPQGQVQVIVNLLDFGMNLQEAGDAPRVMHDGSSDPTGIPRQGSGTVYMESGFPYETVRALMYKGHKIGISLDGYGGYQAIMWDAKNKVYFGASESRKDGQAAGY